MKDKLKAFIKTHKLFYYLYFLLGSLFLKILGIFTKGDENLMLFVSYGGQKYDDSPRVIYEYLLQNPVCEQHKYVWAFIDPEKFRQVENSVKIDTLEYYITALKARYWITNSSVSRGLDFKKRKTRNILFQHGMVGIKKIGIDIEEFDKAFRIGFNEQFDYIFIEGRNEIDILSHAWQKNKSVFYLTGLPRNDNLMIDDGREIEVIKKRLGLPANKKVILYAPTFREFSRYDGQNALGIPLTFSKWEAELGNEYVMLITAHYEVAKLLDDLPLSPFIFNMFKYPELNDLLKVSDVLISDYSSIVFDYSILERPIFCYGYDYDNYLKNRGVYIDLNTLFSHGILRTEAELLDAIKNMNYQAECIHTKKKIKDKYIGAYGGAAEKAVRIIFGK